jgi:hypothetical protein
VSGQLTPLLQFVDTAPAGLHTMFGYDLRKLQLGPVHSALTAAGRPTPQSVKTTCAFALAAKDMMMARRV